MKGLPAETDFVVLGTGLAGLRAAIELAATGRVILLSKSEIPSADVASGRSSQTFAELPPTDEDQISLHMQDSLNVGDGLCKAAALKTLLEEGAAGIAELISWDTPRGGAKLVFAEESPQGHNRALRAQDGNVAPAILRILLAKARSLKNISLVPFAFSTRLLLDSGCVAGVALLDEKGTPQEIRCSAVLLATGGMGHVYRTTTNAAAATADGVALAYGAGAEVSDMEFIQFCPTALSVKKAPRFLLSEALRADGAHLRNFELNRFMTKYHPLGELAPRASVGRAIMHEMEVSRAKDPFVYLDFTHLDANQTKKRFPRIYAPCMQHNIDITEDLVPVRPAAHFAVGGVRTDLDGKTSLPGLYAAGEVAATGVHGANRLPGNALLEGLVFGARAGRAMRQELRTSGRAVTTPRAAYSNGPVDAGIEELAGQIQDVMWNEVGLVRTRVGMQNAIKTLEEMATRLAHPKTRRGYETLHLHTVALLVARSALAREESRGSHYRMDYPDHDDKKFLKHSVVRGEKVAFL
jgi:L-aspartate oxidase